MEKNFGKILVILSIFGLAIYPFSVFGSVIFGLLVLLGAGLILKDKFVTHKVLQPFLLLSSVVLVKSVITFLWSIMRYFAQLGNNYYGSGFYVFLNKSEYFISAILLLYLLVFGILTILFMSAGKDIPLYGAISKKLLGNCEIKTEIKTEKVEDAEIVVETEE